MEREEEEEEEEERAMVVRQVEGPMEWEWVLPG